MPEESRTEPLLIMTMGLPQAGKSWLAQEAAEEYDAPVLCFRKLFQAVMGGRHRPGSEEKALELTRDLIGWYLLTGKTVIYDAMNLNRETRAPFLELARALRVPVYGLWAACGRSERRERLQGLGYSLQQDDLLESLWEAPQADEGFTIIRTAFSDSVAEGVLGVGVLS